MRVVVFTDSLGMPRPHVPEAERTRIDDVYASILRERYRDVHDVDLIYVISLDSENGRYRYHRMVTYREPDVVVVHMGLNDAAPRIFRKGSRPLIYRPWFQKLTRNLGARLVKKYRRQLSRWRNMRYVPPGEFERNMREMLEAMREFNPDVRFLGISIAEVADWLDQRSWGYIRSIREYNAILRDLFGAGFIDVNALLPKDELLISDGYHLSREAHRRLAEEIAGHLDGQTAGRAG